MSSEPKVKGVILGKEELWPSMKKYFEDDQKYRLILMLSGELLAKFKQAVEKEYGIWGPYESRKCLEQALKEWVERKLG